MKAKAYLYLIPLLLTPLAAQAASSFCPNNFSIIRPGDTMASVIEQCGKPDKQETVEKKPEGPQEWSYFVPQTVSANTANAMQGTLKTQIAFDNNGKAINISVNGIGVGATTICNGTNIQLGDSRETVKAACGDPTFVNKDSNASTLPDGNQPTVKITTFTYNTNPPVKLVFENGLLKSD